MMGISNLHDIFMVSEKLVNPSLGYDSPAWSMWLDLNERKESRLTLKDLNSNLLWDEMSKLRYEI